MMLENIKEINEIITIVEKKDFHKIKDIEIKETFKNQDYIVFLNDTMRVLNLWEDTQREYQKIKGMQVVFTQINDIMLRETSIERTNTNIQVKRGGNLNRNKVREMKQRGIEITNDTRIYTRKLREETTKETKSYFLDRTLNWRYNDKFDVITKGLKNAISGSKETLTTITPIEQQVMDITSKKITFIYNDIVFNNERFHKNLKAIFTPQMTLLNLWIGCEITKKDTNGYGSYERNEKIIRIREHI